MSRRSRRGKPAISGILNVDKPAGMTSHDVVASIRRASKQHRVGHAGTLDPLATGVLLVCMGQATRVVEYLMSGRKTYQARIHLGVTTDTYDATGRVLSRASELSVSLAEIEEAVSSFVGQIEQVPPMYSAIKHQGRPLYELARQGIEVERKARIVQVYDFDITGWAPPMLDAEITCSKGTYIRSLAHDLGGMLGCGAHLARLARTASGPFELADAVALRDLLDSLAGDTWQRHLLPMDMALYDYPAWTVAPETARRIRQGQQVASPGSPSNPEPGALCRAYSRQGEFIAVLRYDATRARWQPIKVFATNQ